MIINELETVRAAIAVKNMTRKRISQGIKRSYNTVCLVLRGERKSDNILKKSSRLYLVMMYLIMYNIIHY